MECGGKCESAIQKYTEGKQAILFVERASNNKNLSDYVTLSKHYCHLITGTSSSICSIYQDQKKCTLEFQQDLPKYVALKDLFLSQDKYVKPILTNREQSYESFYNLGLTADYR